MQPRSIEILTVFVSLENQSSHYYPFLDRPSPFDQVDRNTSPQWCAFKLYDNLDLEWISMVLFSGSPRSGLDMDERVPGLHAHPSV